MRARRTAVAVQVLPRGVGMPRAVNSAAIRCSDAPDAAISSMVGQQCPARALRLGAASIATLLATPVPADLMHLPLLPPRATPMAWRGESGRAGADISAFFLRDQCENSTPKESAGHVARHKLDAAPSEAQQETSVAGLNRSSLAMTSTLFAGERWLLPR